MTDRVTVDGKVFARAGQPWPLRGVTYGSFVARLDSEHFPEAEQVKTDFRAMADLGLNTVRCYELPPLDVLDLAEEHDLQVLVGVHHHDWRMEQHPTRDARHRVRAAGLTAVDLAVQRCGGREHVIGIAVGNEVPSDVVRVHGIAAVEDTLSDLVAAVHERSDLLATYVNYPTTEFLEVADEDFICFNVFLEDPCALRRYLRHLQVVARDRPVVITELGLASEIHGRAAQATSLDAQLRVVDETGCAGATVFSWTDEWGVAGERVEGWGFGITDTERDEKPAACVVGDWAHRELVGLRPEWPRVSVVVCAYNEERTIDECLGSLARCRYPDFEVIVCDDGSADATREIARQYPFRLLELPHGGLSRARNAGMDAATGEFVAYLDADAWCHPDWLFHLVLSFDDEHVAATGGPNLPVPGAPFVERAVALSPGGPLEVLTSDDRAEHVPGCNMMYRKDVLEAVGGFDSVYTSAGDDVDVCWKLLDEEHEIAFAHAAQVRHHRRASVRGYLRQQRGYGRAEKMLTGAHPQRFNRIGQARWNGVIYGGAAIAPSLLRPVVYHGYQGASPFQPIARRRAEHAGMWASALVPAAVPIVAIGAILGVVFSPWWFLLLGVVVASLAAYGAAVAVAVSPIRAEPTPLRLRALVGALHVAQPLWRTYGRLRGVAVTERGRTLAAWSGDRWSWLRALADELREAGCHVEIAPPDHAWDLSASVGLFVSARITTAVVWSWTPQSRVRFAPRAGMWITVAVAAVLALVFPIVAIALVALVALSAVAEMVRLRACVRAALAQTAPSAGVTT
ncbi:MAG TPA: glycosyltransferase [Acidimicrobiia bacterium]|jgi:glycosyltransferase involved in cell wall biosynthesis/exo-beta-1,3-glucanase (GH17 family)